MIHLEHYGPVPRQVLAEAIANLWLAGRRTWLSLLGLVVGSGSIVALLNIGNSAQAEALRSFQAMGTDMLVVSFPPSGKTSRTPTTTLDPATLRNALPHLIDIAPVSLYSTRLRRSAIEVDSALLGTTGDLAAALDLQMRDGRFLSVFDRRETFAVVGAEVARQLSEQGRPLRPGDQLPIEGYLFDVIGIAARQPNNPLLPLDINHSIVIPVHSLRRLFSEPKIDSLIIRIAPDADPHAMAQALKVRLRALLRGRDVEVRIPQQLLDGLKRQAATFSRLLAGLGGIVLLVAGVGVMNVMLMNLAERRREIGLRLALGARPRDIRDAFLCEALCMSLLGALLGAVLGSLVALIFSHLAGWSLHLAPEALLLGIGSSLLTGLFFGLHPALKASRLQPVEALRDD
ncbi:ABC transporter permease [Pseudomonas gingeri]|uniref:ABC transporter permease n=1 Tax=Pseudomonas gingeri TaxID=117681 RepID=UPI0015A2F6A9|nr:ABC transporter permease [Pseudomonas gingeri]NWD09251.1 ABC transporter permease [Pseudomonas gingeri]NWE34681.1 ABC transporter permease [Pseudomonas gingeri]NWE56483.1 ABC transporter permease [Pseudomonas gingeri]NWF05941.1 ABC transporter permease [Pseudomonas gingeri]